MCAREGKGVSSRSFFSLARRAGLVLEAVQLSLHASPQAPSAGHWFPVAPISPGLKGSTCVTSSQPAQAGWQLAGSREIKCLQRLRLLTCEWTELLQTPIAP